ncbi:preprotein translocase subunit SecY [Blastopirellula marina]|uniref:Protein translocase subunit SecY n=1 Tax=Blastopirellula marina TaxID=124 RepID=A0A2S8FTP5_9BACT|nr:preprotein translocase subunit SecY [Blastopirellula marina]PQO35545.1 preprotein translocase subunit SecY [Blastopirellula marina]PQO48054.1 preprotein translocase subunit SecY [Blastopirellula marina]PTL44184.1 preprotein translocase subunit SecY [Blastopirellula marina]
MWEKIRVIFTVPELRKRILLTLFLLAIYRVGWQITLPMVDAEAIARQSAEQNDTFSQFLQQVSVFSASSLQQMTIFGLGIMPYISASIIFQLLGTVYKPIEDLQKEGETGRKKINEYTRYATVVLCLIQSFVYVRMMLLPGADGETIVNSAFWTSADNPTLTLGWQFVAVMIMTCGTIFLMWLGEQIDEYGIGNGISLLIMAGIVAQMPMAGLDLLENSTLALTNFSPGEYGLETIITLVALFILVVAGVVFITQAQRKIPTQSAKHVRGRKVYGGTKQFLPLRINQAGVMPIIFASSLLMFPQIIFQGLASWTGNSIYDELARSFGQGSSFIYNLCYIVMIYFFCYFWTAITFNPKDVSDNLRNFGSFIPGYRPGRRTAEYLEKVMVRITYVGASFLVVIAIIPTLISAGMGVSPMVASFYGGTGLLIAVSVAFDLVQKIDSHLVMRNYKGLLEA